MEDCSSPQVVQDKQQLRQRMLLSISEILSRGEFLRMSIYEIK